MEQLLRSNNLSSYSNIRHGFFTKFFDFGPQTNSLINIAENKQAISKLMAANDLFTVKQIHSNYCFIYKSKNDVSSEADAIITNMPNIAIGVKTADCVPILIYAPDINYIAAIHAGWRGALSGIINNTIEGLIALSSSPNNMVVAIGPSIGYDSYEVDTLFYEKFLEENLENESFFSKKGQSHYLFDLKSYSRSKIQQYGVVNIEDLNIDTFTDERFFSHRKATLTGDAKYEGRLISCISITLK